jgi:hypothetical protein
MPRARRTRKTGRPATGTAPVDGPKRDTFTATVAFWLSLGFWIPLFNIGFATVAIWQGVRALKLIESAPERFGGRGRAIAAVVIGITTIVLTIAGVVIFGLRQLKCGPLDLGASLI